MSFELLSEPIRKYIRDKGWEQLRPIQTVAIAKIIQSDENYILASRTASGKTEAAFLPILSKINFNDSGVQVLYISPLIALINDQFYRIEELCKYLDVPVTKWHGEAKKSLKESLLKQPNGVVLITPESLEAMFVNKPFNVKRLFANLKYVVIDEIHSFIGADRGVHLKSLLSRLQLISAKQFSIIGLSATIGDYGEAKKFTGDEVKTKVILDRKTKDINAVFRYYKSQKEELPLDLLKSVYLETKENKALIFPNSRGRAEEVAVKLKKISEKVKGHSNYFSHHSSIDREIREYVEYFAKNNKRENFCISCTSTLELGIDIGTVDEVVQIDATHSISSLIQRVGRSGRKEGEASNLFLYATNKWSLLQSIACWLLYKEEFIEPPLINDNPFDILLHQILSIIKEHSGVREDELSAQMKKNKAFASIEKADIEEVVSHLLLIDFIEKIQNEIILGIEGEKIVNSRDFYSVFKTEDNFKVVNAGISVGEIPFSPQIIEGENIYLSAKIWKIVFVDHKLKKIEVVRANDGKKTIFYGSGASVHRRVREKMLEILYSDYEFDFLDESGLNEIKELRREFTIFRINNLQFERPLLVSGNKLEFFSFTGTRVNRAIQLIFNIAGIKNSLEDSSSSFEIELSKDEFYSKLKNIALYISNIDNHILALLQSNPNIMNFSKWGVYLPDTYKVRLLKQKYYDISGASMFLENIKLVENK